MAPGKLKSWLESFALKPQAELLLFAVAFIEASVFPLSVDVVLVALGVAAPKKAWRLAMVAAAGSILGGYLGYAIGSWLFESVGKELLSFHGITEKFRLILDWYHERGILTLLLSGLTPIPYITFTIAAGFNHTLDLLTLTLGAVGGRLLRFSIVGGLLAVYGVRAKSVLDRSFGKVAVGFVLVVIAGIIVFKWVM
jgi:membrane protein YqaA with SNARE-associated domain